MYLLIYYHLQIFFLGIACGFRPCRVWLASEPWAPLCSKTGIGSLIIVFCLSRSSPFSFSLYLSPSTPTLAILSPFFLKSLESWDSFMTFTLCPVAVPHCLSHISPLRSLSLSLSVNYSCFLISPNPFTTMTPRHESQNPSPPHRLLFLLHTYQPNN